MKYQLACELCVKLKIKGCFFKEVCFVNKKSNLSKLRDNSLQNQMPIYKCFIYTHMALDYIIYYYDTNDIIDIQASLTLTSLSVYGLRRKVTAF